MADYLDVIFWSLIGGLFSLIGGVLLLLNRRVAGRISDYASPFAAGALLGAAFFDLLPEAIEANAEGAAFRWAVVGIVVFFLLEHYLHWFHHHHEHASRSDRPTVPFMIAGDTIHNAIDGVAIAAALQVSIPVGIVTAIAVAAHEIPQEIGDFGVMLKSGMSRLRVLMWNALSSLSTLAAALLTFWLGSDQHLPLGAVLGLSAGMFIYIAASDLIPTIHEEAKGRFLRSATILLILGVVVVALATDFAHEHIHEDHPTHQGQRNQ